MNADLQALKASGTPESISTDPLHSFHEGTIDRHQLHQMLAKDLCGWLDGVIRHSPLIDATGQKFAITDLSQGWTNITFAITSGQGSFVAKVDVGVNNARTDSHTTKWSMFQKEHHWQHHLRINDPFLAKIIPKHHGCAYVRTSDAPDFLVDYARQFGHETIAVSLQQKRSGDPVWTLPPSKQEVTYHSLGKVASAINRVETSGLGPCYSREQEKFYFHLPTDTESVKSYSSFLADLARESLPDWGFAPATLRSIEELINRFEQAQGTPILVFGDFNSGNFLCDPGSGRISALFDFETMRSGLGMYDELAGALLMMNPQEYHAFVGGYASHYGISGDQFIRSHRDDILSSAWVKALGANDIAWKEPALRRLELLLAVEG